MEMGDICKIHLKYLINFRLLRMVIDHGHNKMIFSLNGSEIDYNLKAGSSSKYLLNHEKELIAKGIPFYSNDIPPSLMKEILQPENLSNPVLWGWSFDKYERKVIVSLLSDDQKNFSSGDIEILKLVVDCLQAKFQEIYLKRQLAIRNENLSEAYETIKKKNEEIRNIVKNQKATIEERTHEIAEKNEKLLQISVLNAHNVREPLSRIQGIVQLFELFDDESCRKELIPKLEESAAEMDKVLREVIEMASNELAELKASKI